MVTATPIELALPCRLVTLQFKVGPEGGATMLEDLVARAVLLGCTKVKRLADLFALPRPIMVEVLSGLFAKGHVTVDFDTGAIDLSETARDHLAGAGKGSLLGAGTELKSRRFLFEPVTQQIFPDDRRAERSAREGSLRLPLRNDVTESDIPEAGLIRAVQKAIEDGPRMVRTRVLEVSFGNPALREPAMVRWLHVQLAVRRDVASDRLSVAVGSSRWAVEVERRLSLHIADFADREPDHEFVRQLKGRADLVLAPPEPVDVLLHKLGDLSTGLEQVEPRKVAARHRDLKTAADRVQQGLILANRSRAEVTLVTGAPGHEWAVSHLADSAERQLVVVAPTVDYQRLRELLTPLRKALERGVQLVVMWGRGPEDRLPQRASTAFSELAQLYGDKVLVATRSSRTEACLVIQDDRCALVGSHSPLACDQPGKREISLLVEAAEKGEPRPDAVFDLLLWARKEFPHAQVAQRIKLHRREFGPEAAPGESDRAGSEPRLPEFPGENPDEAAVRLWAASWQEFHEALVETRRRSNSIGPTVEVVKDGEHRTVLWAGLRTARRRLVIADDRIDARHADAAMAKAVRERRAAGVAVHLVHPQVRASGSAPEPFAALGSGPDRVSVRHANDGGRIVVADDEILAGSFSPLGEDGERSRVDTRRSQIGLHVQGEALAADAASLIGAPAVVDDDEPVPEPESSAPRTSTVPAIAGPLLFEARNAADRPGFADVVTRRLREIDDPWQVLGRWRDDGVPAAELRVAAAALLQSEAPAVSAQGRTWARWLVADAWERGAFVEAALLGPLAGDEPDGLGSSAALAAALELGPLGTVLSDAALELALLDHAAGAQAAGAAGAIAELLIWGGGEGSQALDLLSGALPAAWSALAVETIRYAAQDLGPLPLAALEAEQTRATAVAASNRLRGRMAADIDKIEQLRGRFDFDTGVAVHDALFAADGLLTLIREAAWSGNTEFLKLRSVLPTDVMRYLNKLIDELGAERMAWRKQTSFLHRVEEIVRSARAVANGAIEDGADELGSRSAKGHLALGRHAATAWDRLFAEAESVPRPYCLPLLAVLAKLDPLVQSARQWA